jgi:hypothetical protein
MSDTLENVRIEDIENALTFVWALLQQVDTQAETPHHKLSG